MKSLVFVSIPILIFATTQHPDFSGTWERDARLSQDPFVKIENALGKAPRTGARSSGVVDRNGLLKDVDRNTLRAMLLDFAQVMDHVQTEHAGGELKVWMGRDDARFSLFYLDGEKHARQLPEGLRLEATARWEGDNVYVEQIGESGGRILEIYSLLKDGKQLAIVFQLEHKAADRPIVFRTVYDRIE